MEGNLPTLEEVNPDQYRTFHTFGSSSTVLDQSPFPETWKKEKSCAICEAKLSAGRGDTKKRHGCKFCLHAVCKECSPLRTLHPESGRNERICTNCFKSQVESQMRSELAALKPNYDAERLEMSQKLAEESKKRTDAEAALNQLRFATDENATLRSLLAEESKKLHDAELRLSHFETELASHKLESSFQEKNFETSLMALQQSVDKYRKTLALKMAELMGTKKQLEQYKSVVVEMQTLKDDPKKVENDKSGMGFMALSTAKQIHSMQVSEISAQVEDLKAKLAERQRENDALQAKLRECEDGYTQKMSKVLQETQQTIRELTESQKENANLKAEISELRESMENVVKSSDLDSDSLYKELKSTSERRIAAMKDKFDHVSQENEELQRQKEELSKEIARLNGEMEEVHSLLSLAKEDVLSENQQRVDLEAKQQRFEGYMDKLEEMDQLNLRLKEQSAQAGMAVELISRQRLEIEHYKHHLKTTQETLEKCEELIRAGHDQHQTERKLILRRDAEIEFLRNKLLSNGIDTSGITNRCEGETELTKILKEKEEKVGQLGQELQENMERVKETAGRKSRHSGVSRGVAYKPPVSTDPCACSIF